MRFLDSRALRIAAFGLALVACNADRVAGPSPMLQPGLPSFSTSAMPDVRISEIHYDNVGADAGEKIEISGPAGTVLTNYKIYLYNGNPTLRTVYATLALSGTIPATCGTRGVVVVDAVGMQNGGSATAPEPDGLALVNDTQVIEFLSYEGVFAASGGPANGLTSTDIGVAEPGNDPIGLSLQRQPDGSWARINPSTFGTCNDDNSGTVTGRRDGNRDAGRRDHHRRRHAAVHGHRIRRGPQPDREHVI